MKFTRLADEQREFFDRNGYLVVRNALDADMVERVTAACDRIADKDKNNGSRRTSLDNVLPEDDVFLSLLTWETTVPLVVQLLSYDIRLAKSHLIYNYPDPPDAKPSTHWHRDFMESPFDLGPHRYPRLMIKIAYQLTDTTRSAAIRYWCRAATTIRAVCRLRTGRTIRMAPWNSRCRPAMPFCSKAVRSIASGSIAPTCPENA